MFSALFDRSSSLLSSVLSAAQGCASIPVNMIIDKQIDKLDFHKNVKTFNQVIGKGKFIAIAISIASIAFAVLGIALSASGVGVIAGISIFLISLPLLYFGLNSWKAANNLESLNTSENIKQILKRNLKKFVKENPRTTSNAVWGCQASTEKIKEYIKDDVKQEVKKGTFCFDWCIDLAFDRFARF